MEEQYAEFDSHDWDNDEDFQAGLRQVLQTVPKSDETVLRAKTYFFKRKHNTDIDLEGYLRWKNSTPPPTDGKEPLPTSYAGIVELIMSGKPVPGVRQIPDTILGEEASSKPEAPKRRKPWEQ